MRIDTFQMERTQCLYENEVRWNLSESGVLPLRVEELLDGDAGRAELLSTGLKYPESNGSRLLRERIALFYPGATTENVLVTTGTSEANYTALWSLLQKGDRVAVMLPSYLQAWGLARAFAGRADAYRLVEKRRGLPKRWELDVESLRRAVSRRTRVIMVTNPNNPTGAVLTEDEMDAIVAAARKVGAWIVADEVYRGAEVGGRCSFADILGPLLPGHRDGRALEGLRAAGPADRLDRGAAGADGAVLVVPGLHDAHAHHAVRPAGPGRHGAAAARRDPGPDARDHPPAASRGRGVGPLPRGTARVHPRRWPGQSRSSSTGSRSVRWRFSTACVSRSPSSSPRAPTSASASTFASVTATISARCARAWRRSMSSSPTSGLRRRGFDARRAS